MTRRTLRWREAIAPLAIAGLLGAGIALATAEPEAQPTPAPVPSVPEIVPTAPSAAPAPSPTPSDPQVLELVPQAKLVKAVRARDAARAQVRALRAEVRTLRAALHDRDAYRAEGNRYRPQFMCIAGHESHRVWTTATGNGYYGGLQMDRDFQRTYGPELYFRKGTADHWTADEQIAVASRAVPRRGFTPWPNTARMCGLL